jgi:hypothetical protein
LSDQGSVHTSSKSRENSKSSKGKSSSNDSSTAGSTSTTISSSSNNNTQQSAQKPGLFLVLQHSSQQPAALAVLAALYGVSEIHLLPQEQQLQAALLADMWQVPGAASTAVELLVAAVKEGGLSEDAAEAFIELDAIPDFLLPVFSAAVA